MDVGARLERLSRAAMALKLAVLDSPATTRGDVRRAAFDGSLAAPALADYVALVAQHPYRVTDATLSALRSAGMSEDEIFELTVASAVGAAQRRLEAAVELVDTTGDS